MGGWSGGEAEGLTKILFWHPNSISSDIFDLGDNTQQCLLILYPNFAKFINEV